MDRSYLRAENVASTNGPLIDAKADIAVAQVWGWGLVAAVDAIYGGSEGSDSTRRRW